jgi:peptidylprolyl isomerase
VALRRIVLALGLAAAVALPAAAAARLKPVKLPPPVWRDADAENTVVIDTNKGRIIAELYPEVAPQSVARIKQLVRMHFYDGLTFFRVIEDFMDQTGDPQNTGQGGSVMPNLPGEFTFKHAPGDVAIVAHLPGADGGFLGALPVVSQPQAMAALMTDGRLTAHGTFCPGVLGMARANDPDSANSQFFIMRGPRDNLDTRYTPFGRVLVGEDVVRQIKTGEPVADPQDRMTRVAMLADLPDGVRPTVKVVDTRSAYFAALANNAHAKSGDDFSLCEVEVAAQAK